MIAPYVEKDPTAFCSYEDHMLAADTLEQVCLLRAQSVRGQLEGEIPPTIRGQQENPGARLEAEHIQLEDLGDFEDLEESRERHWKIWETLKIWRNPGKDIESFLTVSGNQSKIIENV